MATRGSYVHNSMVGFSGVSRKFGVFFFAVFSENLWFQTIRFTGLLELIQLYKQKRLEKIFYFLHLPKLYIGFKLTFSGCRQKLSIAFFTYLPLLAIFC